MAAFEELGVVPELCAAVTDLGWEIPTPVQCEAVPAILGGSDVLIASPTGSGKTGAFCLPVAQIVWEMRKEELNPEEKLSEKQEWILNMRDRHWGLAIDKGLICESNASNSWNGARCKGGVHTRGKYYYEATIKRDGLCRVGWSTLKANLQLGTDGLSFGFGGTGMKSHHSEFEPYGKSFTTSDVLGCFLDLDNLLIWWSKNGDHFPVAYDISNSFRRPDSALHPAVLIKRSNLELNFGDKPFQHYPGDGFIGVSHAPASYQSWHSLGLTRLPILKNAPLCVILEPTYELVEQTHNNLSRFGSKMHDPSIRCVSTGKGLRLSSFPADLNQELDEETERLDIITSTPKKFVNLVHTNLISLENIRFFIIDEADQFLKRGISRLPPTDPTRKENPHNLDESQSLQWIFSKFPPVASDGSRIQSILCSATLHNFEINKFADMFLHFPQWIDLESMDCVAETVHHVVCPVDAGVDKQWIRLINSENHLQDDGLHKRSDIRFGTMDKETLSLGTKVLKGLYVLKAIDALNMEKAIIFCRTKQQCNHMETYLNRNGKHSVCMHGDLSPETRSQSLKSFKNGSVAFLICTDVAARGLDVSGIPFVISVTLPDDKATYTHRIGRVGRAERMGLSISLVSIHEELVWYHKCRSKGYNCNNRTTCSIWYNEQKLLADIEEHIGITIAQVDSDFLIPIDEFDGKVVYGSKHTQGQEFEGHASSLATSVSQLGDLERSLQHSYLIGVASEYERIRKLVK